MAEVIAEILTIDLTNIENVAVSTNKINEHNPYARQDIHVLIAADDLKITMSMDMAIELAVQLCEKVGFEIKDPDL